MTSIKELWQIAKVAVSEFRRQKIMKLSASLSFFSILTLGPMMLIVIFTSKLLWGSQAIEGTIHSQISSLIGDVAALKVQELIKNATISGESYMAIIGVVVLVIAATTIFTEMQDTMNMIWNLKVKKGRSFQQMLKNRLVSFLIVTGLGFLVIAFLIINGVLEGFMSRLQELFPEVTIVLVYILNLLLTLLLVASLFGFIYKVLPDAIIQWKHVVPGALFGALLFMIGKFVITFYINNSDVGGAYGTAGSFIILLIWIYYSALVLYLGAEFTKAYTTKHNVELKPRHYADVKNSKMEEPTVD